MGQQQLLLIVLSVIIVGIAVVVGINMFSASAASSNLEAVTNDLLNLAARAQQYYVKPGSMKGGEGAETNSFTGLLIADLTAKPDNDNGTYSVEEDGESATITGVGTQDGDNDGTNCTVQVVVTSTGITTTVQNR
ncbi:hypothetical protein A2V82_08140 [candidate division KSB1 bacterium RBG_16_48_16]|nr:MAG: hypothetical protein A2V82_08140 [candidate division KSB1 bacterium RBG_16_48_16]